MTAHNDLDRQLNDFLRDGPTELPYESFDAVRDRTEQTGQRVVIGPWRLPEMNKTVIYGLGAAAVVVLLLVGYQYISSPANTGGPSNPTPTPQAGASSATTPEPSTVGPTDFAAVEMGALRDGDYVFTHMDGVRVVFTGSPAWERNFPNWVVWSVDDDKATMAVSTIENVIIDPCQPELGFQDPAVGPTVDELLTAIEAVPGVTFLPPETVTQDGYEGVRLDYVPSDSAGDCVADIDEPILMTVDGSSDSDSIILAPQGDDAYSLFIFDIDGTRVVVAAAFTPSRTDDLYELLNSVRFDPS